MASKHQKTARRGMRVRAALRKASGGRPRLCVFRSAKNIYAQVIDDAAGRTVASASSIDKELRDKVSKGGDISAAGEVGKLLAQRAAKAGVKQVIFDRGRYLYHGRIKALADAARGGGLEF
jgi:large subunit ribosomal protein L18